MAYKNVYKPIWYRNSRKILKGLNERPNITVRVNNLKIDYDEAFEKLGEYGYNIEEGYICPEAIQIIKGKNIEKPFIYRREYYCTGRKCNASGTFYGA